MQIIEWILTSQQLLVNLNVNSQSFPKNVSSMKLEYTQRQSSIHESSANLV